jgi:hypothetical protein
MAIIVLHFLEMENSDKDAGKLKLMLVLYKGFQKKKRKSSYHNSRMWTTNLKCGFFHKCGSTTSNTTSVIYSKKKFHFKRNISPVIINRSFSLSSRPRAFTILSFHHYGTNHFGRSVMQRWKKQIMLITSRFSCNCSYSNFHT